MRSSFDFWGLIVSAVELGGKFLPFGRASRVEGYPPWVGFIWVCERSGQLPVRLQRQKLPVCPTVIEGFPNGEIHLEIPFEKLGDLPWTGQGICPDNGLPVGACALGPPTNKTLEEANTLKLTVCGETFVFKKKKAFLRVIWGWLMV